ncbi:MAG TPA: KTSC domain-containing protein [Ignavibacteria bacterium]|nr:KTSC domain-containing protein [Ignavibacteria bacterium]
MKRQHVNSTSVRSIGYDEATKTLEVKFIDGDVYQYFKVPEKIYLDLLTASSIGAYLNKEIKGKFEYRKME